MDYHLGMLEAVGILVVDYLDNSLVYLYFVELSARMVKAVVVPAFVVVHCGSAHLALPTIEQTEYRDQVETAAD